MSAESQPTLFSYDVVRNKSADDPWKKSETDKMLDLYLAGAQPKRIAQVLGRNPKAVYRKLEAFCYNENGRAERYEPRKRVSRKGKRLTASELAWIKAHKNRGFPLRHLARVLMRDVSELGLDLEDRQKEVDMRKVGTGVDLVLAYRFLYYVLGISIMSDQAYDAIEKEEMEFGAHGDLLKTKVGSDRREDYPSHIRALALYLAFKHRCKGPDRA